MNKIKKSELKKLIREIIKENKTLLRETAEVTCVFDGTENWGDIVNAIAGTAELPSNCTGNGGVGLNCVGDCNIMITSTTFVGDKTVITFAPSGITTYNPPTPDFDQSFYDEYEGEYGPFPGQEIRPDKTIPGKTSNLGKAKRRIKETIKSLLLEAPQVSCVVSPGDTMEVIGDACHGSAELPNTCYGNDGMGLGCDGSCNLSYAGSVMTISCAGMQVYDPPTPDFDQSFYDTWDGSYGYHPSHGVTPDKTIPGKKSNLGKAKKMIRETIKSLLLEVENYNSAEEAKQNCWMGNGDCLTDNGQAMECNQVYNTQTNTYSNSCGMAIQGGGTLTPNKDKTIPNIKNKNVYKRTNRRSR